MTATEIITFLKNNKNVLRERFYCTEIGLFGSYVRDEQTENSDIDILVVFESGTKNLYDVEQSLKSFLQDHFHRKVDICAKKWISPIFKPLILSEAIYA